jgi:hypothetical protein
MKKILFLIAVCFAFISCNMNAKNGTEAQTQKVVIIEGHTDKPEVRRFLQLAPEILDEVFKDTRILVEFQE